MKHVLLMAVLASMMLVSCVQNKQSEENMNIVVLAAGNSTEREVSIVSGTGVCRALRTRGHRAVLVDAFFGCDVLPEEFFPETYDVEAEAQKIRDKSAMLEEEMKRRRSFFGPGVIGLCQEADFVFLALHGSNGEDGRVQAAEPQ